MSNASTRFADMSAGPRAAWLRWANSHDWGGNRPARFVHDRVRGTVMETTCAAYDRAGNMTIETALYKTPRDLRNWAGY